MNKENSEKSFQYIDSHAHIFLKDFDADRQEVIRHAEEVGVIKILMPNLDHTSIDDMLETEEKFPICKPMMGLHPCYVKKNFEKELYLVEEWLNRKKFVAIGEVGIDLYWDTTFISEQQEALKVQLAFAKKYNLPIVIHCRNSFQETIELLEKNADGVKGVFHCFSGSFEEANRVIELGFKLGIGGVITFKNGGLDKIIDQISLENLLLETDSPYLTPAPNRKDRNNPTNIPVIAKKVADLKKIELGEVAKITTANSNNLFKL